MRKVRDYRNNFSAGVVSKEHLAASREELTQQALKSGTNAFLTNARTVMRRGGTVRKFRMPDAGRTYVFEMPDGTLRHLNFISGAVKIYQEDGTLEDTKTGPWNADDLFTMSIVNDDDRVFIFSNSFFPQTLAYGSAWTLGNFAFRVEANGHKAAPFIGSGLLNLAGVTMNPSGYSGTITVTFSAPVLLAGHANHHFMYVRNQIRIDTVNSPTSASATVIDRLYPTVRVSVPGATNYKVGDLAEGDITNTRGQIVAVGASTVDIVLTEGYSTFQGPDGELSGERLISGEAAYEITDQVTLGSPSATNIWFEEAISAARGYPSTAALHRTRLCMAGFPSVPALLACSAYGSVEDYDLGAASERDAILEFIGEDPNAKVKHLVSTEQLVLLTDRGAWYVPEGGDRRFTPQGIGFDPISPDPASDIPPVWTPEGVVFLDKEYRALVLGLTGTQRGAWAVTDISQLGGELIKTPKQMAYSSGIGGRRERVILILNTDGTAAVFTYRRGGDQAGWTPWERRSTDQYLSFSTRNGEVYCLALADGNRTFEQFDFDAVLDSEFDPASTDYPSESVHMLLGSHVVGENATDVSGALGSYAEYSSIDKLGHDFPVLIEPAPLVIAQAGRQMRRITRTWVDVIDSGTFRLNGVPCQGYLYNSDMEGPPAVSDREHRASQMGSSRDRTSTIEQRDGEGAPLHVRSITMRASVR